MRVGGRVATVTVHDLPDTSRTPSLLITVSTLCANKVSRLKTNSGQAQMDSLKAGTDAYRGRPADWANDVQKCLPARSREIARNDVAWMVITD